MCCHWCGRQCLFGWIPLSKPVLIYHQYNFHRILTFMKKVIHLFQQNALNDLKNKIWMYDQHIHGRLPPETTKHFVILTYIRRITLRKLYWDLTCKGSHTCVKHVDWLVQERRNSIANALELRLSSLTHWFVNWLKGNSGIMLAKPGVGTLLHRQLLSQNIYLSSLPEFPIEPGKMKIFLTSSCLIPKLLSNLWIKLSNIDNVQFSIGIFVWNFSLKMNKHIEFK